MFVAVADRAQQVLDEDYDEVLERLRVADYLYTEYSLEEVIYQLAKVMFSQSLNRGEHRIRPGRCTGAFFGYRYDTLALPLTTVILSPVDSRLSRGGLAGVSVV